MYIKFSSWNCLKNSTCKTEKESKTTTLRRNLKNKFVRLVDSWNYVIQSPWIWPFGFFHDKAGKVQFVRNMLSNTISSLSTSSFVSK
jgi:hypothetical protein